MPSTKSSDGSRLGRAVTAFLGEYGFRRVTASAATPTRTFETSDRADVPLGSKAYDRTLTRSKAQNLNKLCWETYKRNPLVWGTTELIVRATVGKKAAIKHNKLESQNAVERGYAERIQLLLDTQWWNAPKNNWPELAENVQRDMLLFGELIPLPLTSALTGDCEIAFLDVNNIKEVLRDPFNTRRVVGIRVALQNGTDRDLQLIGQWSGMAPWQANGGQPPEWFKTWGSVSGEKLVGRLLGECWYWCNNVTLSGLRGQGDFAQVLDPARDAVRIVKGIADRINLNNRVWSEITFPDNWDQGQINAALDPTSESYIHPPRMDDEGDDARVFGHSKAIEMNFKAPAIAAGEGETGFKMCLALFSAGSNIPLHWMGWADELTYASARDISQLPLNYLRDRQGALRSNLKHATDYQLDQWRIFTSQLDGIPEELIYDYDFVLPTIDERTLEQTVAVMKGRTDTIVAASMAGAIDEPRKQAAMQKTLRDGGL